MLTLTARVLNVYKAPVAQSKEGKTYGGDDRIQVTTSETLRNGEERNRLIELRTTDDRVSAVFRKNVGELVAVEVRAWTSGRDVMFELPPDACQ